jgi:hypothetical protein
MIERLLLRASMPFLIGALTGLATIRGLNMLELGKLAGVFYLVPLPLVLILIFTGVYGREMDRILGSLHEKR